MNHFTQTTPLGRRNRKFYPLWPFPETTLNRQAVMSQDRCHQEAKPRPMCYSASRRSRKSQQGPCASVTLLTTTDYITGLRENSLSQIYCGCVGRVEMSSMTRRSTAANQRNGEPSVDLGHRSTTLSGGPLATLAGTPKLKCPS
jgi:hypothetical protein